MAARRTAAAAVLADFRREVKAFCEDLSNRAPEPDAIAWAQRLAAELRSVLEQLAAETLDPADPADTSVWRDGYEAGARDEAASFAPHPGGRETSADRAAAQLAAIRALFEVFDWETDDRQYALEQIEDIVRGES